MGLGGGGGQSQTGWGSSSGSSTTNPNLYTWRDILPPWVQKGQEGVLPWLMNRAQTGMLPQEEQQLWGQAKDTLEDSSQGANRALARQLAMSGVKASSPAAVGGFADLASDKMSQTSKAALDFAKMKMGARDTSIGQLLTALYTPPPSAVGHTTQSQQQSSNFSSGSGGGGGK